MTTIVLPAIGEVVFAACSLYKCHGERMGRDSMRFASASPMNSSRTGSQRSLRPSFSARYSCCTAVWSLTAASTAEDGQNSTEMALVPDVTGMTVIEARDALKAAGFEIDIRSSGLAVRQTPGADEYAEKGSMVTVYFSLDLSAITPSQE